MIENTNAAAAGTAVAVVERPMPTPEEIAKITGDAVENCERAAVSMAEIAAAGERLNAGLAKTCGDAAKMFRTRGKVQADLLTNFATYTNDQCDVVKKLLEQADRASPPAPGAV